MPLIMRRFPVLAALALVVVWFTAQPAAAAFKTLAKQAIMIDANSGQILFQKNADQAMAPSSMVKMMTVYLAFSDLASGKLKLDDTFKISKKAWRMRGSKMFVKVDTEVKVGDLIRGIIIDSGNDAAVAMAEGLAGTESAFVERMNAKARALGMSNTNFTTATGWPDPAQYSTAADLARLARRTIEDFPKYYPYYSEIIFTYGGIKQGNRNPVLYDSGSGADGLKTGHTNAGGYGLTASAKRGTRRLIVVINGLPSARTRATESRRLLDWGFRSFANYALFKAGAVVESAKVWLGQSDSVPLMVKRDVVVTLPRRSRNAMKVAVVYKGPITAPIKTGSRVANLVITAPDTVPIKIPLFATRNVAKAGFFGRAAAAIEALAQGALN